MGQRGATRDNTGRHASDTRQSEHDKGRRASDAGQDARDTQATRKRHASDTQATRKRHASDTQATRKRHAPTRFRSRSDALGAKKSCLGAPKQHSHSARHRATRERHASDTQATRKRHASDTGRRACDTQATRKRHPSDTEQNASDARRLASNAQAEQTTCKRHARDERWRFSWPSAVRAMSRLCVGVGAQCAGSGHTDFLPCPCPRMSVRF